MYTPTAPFIVSQLHPEFTKREEAQRTSCSHGGDDGPHRTRNKPFYVKFFFGISTLPVLARNTATTITVLRQVQVYKINPDVIGQHTRQSSNENTR